MTTILQFVLLLSVITGIVGGCGMEMRYIVMTVLLIKLSWMVISWWRTFQHERDNKKLHRRLACGAAMILFLSLSQLAFTYFISFPGSDSFEGDEAAIAQASSPAPRLPTGELQTSASQSRRSQFTAGNQSIKMLPVDFPLD